MDGAGSHRQDKVNGIFKIQHPVTGKIGQGVPDEGFGVLRHSRDDAGEGSFHSFWESWHKGVPPCNFMAVPLRDITLTTKAAAHLKPYVNCFL